MKIKSFITILAAFVFATSCSYSASEDFSSLADELEANSANYTVEDWENVIYQYEGILEEMQNHDIAPEERREIGRQQGRCLAYITKGYAIIAAKEGINDLNQLKGMIEGFTEGLGRADDIENSVNNLFNDLLN